jgi:hypothetical protein
MKIKSSVFYGMSDYCLQQNQARNDQQRAGENAYLTLKTRIDRLRTDKKRLANA